MSPIEWLMVAGLIVLTGVAFAIQGSDYLLGPRRTNDGRFRVGWFGSSFHVEDEEQLVRSDFAMRKTFLMWQSGFLVVTTKRLVWLPGTIATTRHPWQVRRSHIALLHEQPRRGRLKDLTVICPGIREQAFRCTEHVANALRPVGLGEGAG